MLTLASERFGRIVAEELAKVRLEVSSVRLEMSSVRLEMSSGLSQLRLELSDCRNDLRAEIAHTRVEVLRWSFLFGIGQVAAVAGLLSFIARGLR